MMLNVDTVLNAFYATLFKPGDSRYRQTMVGPLIGVLVVLILAFNAAGRLHVGAVGLVLVFLLFLGAGLLGLFWFTAALMLSTRLFEGQGTGLQTAEAISRGVWPLVLSGVAIATTPISRTLATLFSLGLILGTFITLSGSVRQLHQLTWLQTVACLFLTLVASWLSLLGLVIWPLMVLLGT